MDRFTKQQAAGQCFTLPLIMLLLSISFALLLANSARAASQETSEPTAVHGLRLPASFRGTLPCADCEGVRHQLDLWPDQVFHLRREWIGKSEPQVRDDIGRWSYDAARKVLVLRGGAEMPLQFEIKGPDLLRALDMQGRPIVSQLPYDLASDGTLAPFDVSIWIGGEMTYLADSARLTECLTGRSYPIAMEGDYLTMERAYTGAAKPPGSPLYVTFEGEIAARKKMEGSGTEPTVVVRKFTNIWPGQRCERARADASLSNTYWRIEKLGAERVAAREGQREPRLLLREGDDRHSYSATVGCNELIGGYSLAGEEIRFLPGATTLAACPEPLDSLERRLLEVLAKSRGYRVVSQTLELLDETGAPIALFEAVYF